MNLSLDPTTPTVRRRGPWSDLLLQFFYGQIYCSTA
jgi:hypothetical protein